MRSRPACAAAAAALVAGRGQSRPRPTFDGRSLLLEVHLLEGGGDLYGQRLRVAFAERLRGERKFAGIDELKAQIARDCDHARAIHALIPASAVPADEPPITATRSSCRAPTSR